MAICESQNPGSPKSRRFKIVKVDFLANLKSGKLKIWEAQNPGSVKSRKLKIRETQNLGNPKFRKPKVLETQNPGNSKTGNSKSGNSKSGNSKSGNGKSGNLEIWETQYPGSFDMVIRWFEEGRGGNGPSPPPRVNYHMLTLRLRRR